MAVSPVVAKDIRTPDWLPRTGVSRHLSESVLLGMIEFFSFFLPPYYDCNITQWDDYSIAQYDVVRNHIARYSVVPHTDMVHNDYVPGTHHKRDGCIPCSQATEQSIAIGDKFRTLTERMAISPEHIMYVECGRFISSLRADPVVSERIICYLAWWIQWSHIRMKFWSIFHSSMLDQCCASNKRQIVAMKGFWGIKKKVSRNPLKFFETFCFVIIRWTT